MFNIAFQYINPTQGRANTLYKSWKKGSDISEPVNLVKLESNERILVLICLRQREVISHISWGRKGNSAGTALTKLNLDRIQELKVPIDLRIVRESEYFSGMIKYFDGREVFVNSDECHEIITSLRSNFSEIELYISESIADYILIDELSPHKRLIVRQEHDAVEMALRIAGMIPRKSYLWSPTKQKEDKIVTFFSGLARTKHDEDDVVRWDADKIPGLDVINKEVFGHYILSDGTTTLHTFHANKTALENTLGVDLIYFNEQHKNFVFVQYKMAETQGNTHIFRFPNSQLTEELHRMDSLSQAILANEVDQSQTTSASDYRMLHDPFFLKFCPRDAFDPDQHEQIRGMLIPVTLWRLIENDTSTTFSGPLGGRFLSFENCPRYFDNTRFIALMQEGWFGTSSSSQNFLEQVITEIINSKRSVILAAKISTLDERIVTPPNTPKKSKKKSVKRRPANRK